jgi:thioredoxin-related protein
MFNFLLRSLVVTVIMIFTQQSLCSQEVQPDKDKVLYFGANWCPPCRLMKKNVLADKDVKKVLKGFNFKVLDIDIDIKEKMKYGIKVVPTTLVIRDKKIYRYTGYLNKKQFLSILK